MDAIRAWSTSCIYLQVGSKTICRGGLLLTYCVIDVSCGSEISVASVCVMCPGGQLLADGVSAEHTMTAWFALSMCCTPALQAFVSRARVESFSLTADMMYVSTNAPRIGRAVFEICLRRSWSAAAELALRLCKVQFFRTPCADDATQLPRDLRPCFFAVAELLCQSVWMSCTVASAAGAGELSRCFSSTAANTAQTVDLLLP